jgi:hypothetical protein
MVAQPSQWRGAALTAFRPRFKRGRKEGGEAAPLYTAVEAGRTGGVAPGVDDTTQGLGFRPALAGRIAASRTYGSAHS